MGVETERADGTTTVTLQGEAPVVVASLRPQNSLGLLAFFYRIFLPRADAVLIVVVPLFVGLL